MSRPDPQQARDLDLGTSSPTPREIVATLWSLLAGRRTTLVWLGLLVAAETALVLGGTWLLRHSANQDGHRSLILTGSLLAAGLTAGLSLIGAATSWLGTKVGLEVTSETRRDLLSRLLSLPQARLERAETASLLSRLNEDLPWASHAFVQIYRSLLADAPVMLLLAGYLLTLSGRLTLTTLAFAPPIVWWSVWTARRMSGLARTYSDELAHRSAFQQDVLSRAALLKTSGALDTMLGRYHQIEDRALTLALRLMKRNVLADPVGVLLAVAALVAVALVGSAQVEDHSLSQGTYLAFLAGLGMLVVLVRRMSGRLAGVGRSFGALARVVAFHNNLPKPAAEKGPLTVREASLTFEGVTFHYAETPKAAALLQNFDMHAEPGHITVVAGPSGVGKSTLLKLGAGLYEPTEGRVLLGDRDLAHTSPGQRAQWIAWLGQEAFLLDDTIAFNLTLGRDLPRERLRQALREVGLEALVARMDASVADRVGEEGRHLSAGQRRRLALARCLLSPAKVLLLDEPTESLDDETAARIVALLRSQARSGRTVLVATHDQRICSQADLLIELASHK